MDVAIERAGDRVNLHLSGHFDIHSNTDFRNAFRPWLTEEGVASLAVDLSDIPYMDSSGLGMLLLLRDRARAAGKSVVLTHCGPNLQRLLEIAHFDSIFRIE